MTDNIQRVFSDNGTVYVENLFNLYIKEIKYNFLILHMQNKHLKKENDQQFRRRNINSFQYSDSVFLYTTEWYICTYIDLHCMLCI